MEKHNAAIKNTNTKNENGRKNNARPSPGGSTQQSLLSSPTPTPPIPTPSLSSQRAHAALDWVEQQIQQLTAVIRNHGTRTITTATSSQTAAAGHVVVSIAFGHLFDLYQDISSSLVGILLRARQRNVISYSGDMLYQGTHSDVTISLVEKDDSDSDSDSSQDNR